MHSTLRSYQTILFRSLLIGLFLCATPASALTVSGTLYSDEGLTTIASGKTIKIAVGTSTPATVYTTTTDGSSNYSFTFSSLTATASLVIWVDATTSIRAATYTRASSTSNNITGIPLYQNRVIISHEGATTTTSVSNSDLAFYDATNDSDIQYDASSTLGTLLVSTGSELHVMTGKQFAPMGNVTIHGNGSASTTDGAFHLPANSIYVGPATTTIAGNFSASSSATLYSFGNLHFTATTTGKTINATIPLGNLVFSNTQSISFATNATTTDILVNSGATVVAPSQFTITGDYTNNGTWTAGATTTIWAQNDTQVNGWATVTPPMNYRAWSDIAYGNSIFVAVSADGIVMTSPDGTTWTTRTAAESNSWRSVTYGNGLFIAVSDTGTNRVMTSPDGIIWTARSAIGTNHWSSVVYGNGIFVAVACAVDPVDNFCNTTAGNRVMTSPDGITWTARTAASEDAWTGIAYGNGLFVAVGGGVVMTSPDGISWTTRTGGGGVDVAFGNGLFVTVGSGAVTTSYDGITWATHNLSFWGSATAIGYGDGLFVGVEANDTSFAMVSTDGVNWTERDMVTPNDWASVAYGNGVYVAVGYPWDYAGGNGSAVGVGTRSSLMNVEQLSQTLQGNMIGSSAWNSLSVAGTSTHTVTLNSPASTTDLSIYSGLLVNATSTSISKNFVNQGTFQAVTPWTTQTLAEANIWQSITYGKGLFVAVAAGQSTWGDGLGNLVMTSPDGVTWTAHSAAQQNIWRSVTYANGIFVAVSEDGANRVMTSPDGITWTPRSAAEQNVWVSVAYGNGLFVAVACGLSACGDGLASHQIMTSPDGITWTPRNATSIAEWNCIAFGSGIFIVAASDSDVHIMTSVDGVNWIQQTTAGIGYFQNVVYEEGLFTLFASAHAPLYSRNGSHWEETPMQQLGLMSQTVLNGSGWPTVLYVNGQYVQLVGDGFSRYIKTSTVSTTTFSGTSAQSITGSLSGSSSFGHLAFTGSGTKTFGSNASSTNFQIASGATVVAPSALSITGDYSNSGTFTANSGTVFMTGYATQTMSGTMTGSSAFSNLTIMNTSGAGSSTQSINFSASASTTGTFTMLASTSARFLASATSTFQNIALKGSLYKPVWLRSSTVGTRFAWAVPGTQSQVTYVDVRDSSSCPTTITVTNGTNSGNTNCWSFTTLPIITGTAYTDEGTTPFEFGNIKVAVGSTTVGTFSATSDAFGFWDVVTDSSHVFATGTKLLTWIDNTASITGALFTKASSTANIFNLSLYQNRLFLGRQYATTTTNVDLSFYDADDDSDVPYMSNGGFLQVKSGNELHVGANVTFAPAGAVTIHGNGTSTPSTDGNFHLDIGSTYTAGATTTIAGSFTASTSVTFTPGNYTLLFTATTTGKTIDTQFSTSFGTTTFDGVGGVWSFVQQSATTSNITVNNGTMAAPQSLVVTGNYVNGGILQRTGGQVWTGRSAVAGGWGFITYGNGLFVAIAESGVDQVMTSPNGITWTARAAAEANQWRSVTYGNGLFVAVARTGTNRVMTSPDGITWTARAAAEANQWMSVTYGNGLFVAVSQDGTNQVMTSPDGITWTARAGVGDWYSVTYGNGLFVAVGYNCIMTSSDGITWTARTSPYGAWSPEANWTSVTYGNGIFLTIGTYGGVMTSPDGITWTITISLEDNLYSLTYGNGLFVAVSVYGYQTFQIQTSFDGITWTGRRAVEANQWMSVTYGNGLFVAVSWDGTYQAMTSPAFSTTTFSGTTQSVSGDLTGFSALNHVSFSGSGTKIFANNASTSDLTISSGVTMIAPTTLSIAGNYTNNGTSTFGSGTVYFSGYDNQIATGTMTGTSAFTNIIVTNNRGTTTFMASASTTGTFYTNTPGARIAFKAGATTSIQNLTIIGNSGTEVALLSTIAGTKFNLYVPGISSVSYASIKDSNACPSGTLSAGNSVNGGNNTCWTFDTLALDLLHYRFRMDHESEASAGYYAAEDSALMDRIYRGDRIRLRFSLRNTSGSALANYDYQLEYASSSCSAWTTLAPSKEWMVGTSPFVPTRSSSTDASGLTNPGGSSFFPGVMLSGYATTGLFTIPGTSFTEHEYTIMPTATATPSTTYCFRLTNAGSVTNFIYMVQPQLQLRGVARPESGGFSIEPNGVGPLQSGGVIPGGSGTEGSGSGGQQGGGVIGGGGGDSG